MSNLLHNISGIFLIVRRSLRQHALSTCVTLLATALASGLVMSVFAIQRQTYEAFTGGQLGFDAVLGARGSQLQLVLNTVFHLETSPGNIPWAMYQAMKADRRVEHAIPYATGDNYQGFRIVGTTDELFTKFQYRAGRTFEVQSGGRFFDSSRREAVMGSFAAARTGLKPGATFNPYHGLTYSENSKHNEEYTVVGILKPTNSPSDRVMFIPIEGIFRMGGHVLRGTGQVYQAQAGVSIPDEAKEVSAVMLKFKNPKTGFDLDMTINKQGKVATLAYPIGRVMSELFDKLGWINRVLELVAYLVVVVVRGDPREYLQHDQRAPPRIRDSARVGRAPRHGVLRDPVGSRGDCVSRFDYRLCCVRRDSRRRDGRGAGADRRGARCVVVAPRVVSDAVVYDNGRCAGGRAAGV